MLTDGLEWCGLLVDYCDVFISCLDSHSDGTHSLQRIHCWTSDGMLHFSKSDEETNSSTSWMASGWAHFYFCINKSIMKSLCVYLGSQAFDSLLAAPLQLRCAGTAAGSQGVGGAERRGRLRRLTQRRIWTRLPTCTCDRWISTWAQISPAAAILPRRVKHQYTNISDCLG